MYSLIYNLFFSVSRFKKSKNKNSKLFSLINNYIEWYYNVYWIKHCMKNSDKYRLNSKKREQKIIVSLTSYPKRSGTVWVTIETLFRQSVKPDKIILWLAENQYNGVEGLPQELIRLQEKGLEIRFCDDLRSHKKYYYVMQEYPNDLIILADDDMFYPSDMIAKLLKLHKKYPNDICTSTCQVIEPKFDTNPSLWRNPRLDEKFEHSDKIQVFTGSGSLFPPNCLDKEVFNIDAIKNICPNADDLWLTYMAFRKGTKITALYKWRAFPITIYGTAQDSLWYINSEGGQNDVQWASILEKYGKIGK